jgi:hypothetical protein
MNSPSLATPPKSFGRLASKRFVSSIFGSPSTVENEWAAAQNAVKQARLDSLRRPLSMTNGDIFGLTLRFLSEMEFTTHSTGLAFYNRCFTGRAFVNWAMEQRFRDQEFRDEADAVFLANELLIRGIIAPIAKGKEDKKTAKWMSMGMGNMNVGVGKGWRVFNGGDWKYTVKKVARSAIIAACFESSTEEEKNGIRECVGRLKTLKALIDGETEASASAEEEDDEDGEGTVTATALAAAKERLNTTKKYVFLPFRKAEEVIERASDAIAKFFSTLGPHVVLALGSLVFMVWIQNFAFACVLAVAFARHILWVNELHTDDLLIRTRADMLRKFQLIRGDPSVNKSGAESADWWSAVFHHMWQGWMAGWLNRTTRETIEWSLDGLDLPFISKLELSEFRFGDNSPIIKTARTFGGSDGEMIVEWDLDWPMENSIVMITAMFGRGTVVPIPIRIRLADLRLSGTMRMMFTWMRKSGGPYVRSLRVSFVGLPTYSFSLKTFGAVNLSEVGFIHSALRRTTDEYFKTELCEPNGYFWDVKEWWESWDAEEVIDPRELITQPLMKDIERIWKRSKTETTVEVRVLPYFAEFDLSGKHSSNKMKYLDAGQCRMCVGMEYGKKRVVSKSHSLQTHVESSYADVKHPTWRGNGFAKLDATEDVVGDQITFFVLSQVGNKESKDKGAKKFGFKRKMIAVGKLDDVLRFDADDINSVEVTLLDPKNLEPVGVLHVRLRVNVLKPNVVVEHDKNDSVLGVRISAVYRSMSMLPGQAAEFASTSSRRFVESTSSLCNFTCCFRGGDADEDIVPHTPGTRRNAGSRPRIDHRDMMKRSKSRIGNDVVEAEDYGIAGFVNLSAVERREAGLESDSDGADDDDFPKTVRAHAAVDETMDDAQIEDEDEDEN